MIYFILKNKANLRNVEMFIRAYNTGSYDILCYFRRNKNKPNQSQICGGIMMERNFAATIQD